MKSNMNQHRLLILSKDQEIYLRLIEQARLPGLTLTGASGPDQVTEMASECDLVFGESALISTVINQLAQVK
jgi:hypothetical protein